VLERFSITVAAATIISVLGKLALLFRTDQETGKDWFKGPVEQVVLCHLLLAVFLVFFRGKMMHDDAAFFTDLSKAGIFKAGTGPKKLIKFGLLLGYVSWLLWAPAIFFLEDRIRFAGFLIASLAVSTVCLAIDLLARVQPDWKRAFWIIPNMFYIGLLVLLMWPSYASIATVGLLVVLVIDWLISDPMTEYV
jgi:hypothetical protein